MLTPINVKGLNQVSKNKGYKRLTIINKCTNSDKTTELLIQENLILSKKEWRLLLRTELQIEKSINIGVKSKNTNILNIRTR